VTEHHVVLWLLSKNVVEVLEIIFKFTGENLQYLTNLVLAQTFRQTHGAQCTTFTLAQPPEAQSKTRNGTT